MNKRIIATVLSLSSLMLTVSIYSPVANGWCLFNCKPEKTKEQCEAENEKLRSESAASGMNDALDRASYSSGLSTLTSAAWGASSGYVSGWWKGEDCDQYPSENK